jgi:hypothetical protein
MKIPINRASITTLAEIIGGVLVAIGVGMFSIPAGIITIGLGLIVLGGLSA